MIIGLEFGYDIAHRGTISAMHVDDILTIIIETL